MSTAHGSFVWYELMTTDTKAAEAFYADVIGWHARDAGMPDKAYTLFAVGETHVGGLMALPEPVRAAGGRPGWIGYVAVDDVDASAALFQREGGIIHRPADDIPGVGRFAVVADPHGAVLSLFKGAPMDAPPAPLPPGTPGTAGWHELYAGNGEAAFAFYSGAFGWTKGDAMDMGPAGVYQLFAAGGEPIGGMMTKMDTMPKPFWLYYFNVPAIDAAAARVEAGGGKIVNGPMEVPGGQWIVQCNDPQGAMFAMVAPHR